MQDRKSPIPIKGLDIDPNSVKIAIEQGNWQRAMALMLGFDGDNLRPPLLNNDGMVATCDYDLNKAIHEKQENSGGGVGSLSLTLTETPQLVTGYCYGGACTLHMGSTTTAPFIPWQTNYPDATLGKTIYTFMAWSSSKDWIFWDDNSALVYAVVSGLRWE